MAHGCRVYRTSNLVIPSSTATVVSFDVERWDDGGYHDPLVDPSRITLPEPGRYAIFAGMAFNQYNSSARGQVYFRVNGSSPIPAMDIRKLEVGNTVITLNTIWSFTDRDYLEVVVWSNYSCTLFAAPTYSTEFGVERIS